MKGYISFKAVLLLKNLDCLAILNDDVNALLHLVCAHTVELIYSVSTKLVGCYTVDACNVALGQLDGKIFCIILVMTTMCPCLEIFKLNF